MNGRAIRDHGIVRAAERRIARRSPRACGRRSFSTSSFPPTWSTSTCIRRRRRCAFAIAGWSSAPWSTPCAARSAAARAPRAWGRAPGRIQRRSRRRCPSMSRCCHRRRAVEEGLLAPQAGRLRRPPRIARSSAPAPEVPPLVQLARTYLMFEHDHGVVLIDQHSAHERVLYEQFMGTLERGETPSQRLLFPMTLHLGPAEGEAFEAHRELFAKLGFEIEGFGGHTLIVRSVPMPHPRFDRRALPARDARRADRRSCDGHARAARAARRDRRVQGGDQGRRRAVAGRDARAVHRARATRRSPRTTCTAAHDRAAHLGRDRATLWTHAEPLRVICGPTAAGKTRARDGGRARVTVTIVSADSRQVYRGFDIGTAKPTRAEQRARSAPRHRRRRSDRALLGGARGPRRRRSGSREIARGAARAARRRRHGTLSARARSSRCSRSRRSMPSDAQRSQVDARAVLARTSCGAGASALDPARAHLGRTQLLRAIEIALLTGRAVSSDCTRARPRAPGRGALSCGRSRAPRSPTAIAARSTRRCSTMDGRARWSS